MVQPATRADGRANRERLLAAAVAAFADRGLGAEMRDVAERAGLSVGALYRHFPSRDELLTAVVAEAITAFEEAQDAAFAAETVLAGLHRFVVRALVVVERYGEPLTALLQGQIAAERDDGQLLERRTQIRARTIALIERGIEHGALRRDLDPQIAAAMLRVVFVPRTLADLRSTRSTEQVAAGIVDLFVHGAGIRSAPPAL